MALILILILILVVVAALVVSLLVWRQRDHQADRAEMARDRKSVV